MISIKQSHKISPELINNYILETKANITNIKNADLKMVVKKDNKQIGFITGHKNKTKDGKVFVLNNLFISKEYRKKGLARKLVYSTANLARKKGYAGLDFKNVLSISRKIINKEEQIHKNRAVKKGKTLALFRNGEPNTPIYKKVRFPPRIRKNIRK